MTPLESYHVYCHKNNVTPDIDAPEAVLAATLPYVSPKHGAATASQRALLRAHRASREIALNHFAAHKSPEALARATGLPIADAVRHLSAYLAARGKSLPVPPKPSRELPAYDPPPPLDPADPIADYHRRVGVDPSVRFADLRHTLKVSENAARAQYQRWCAANHAAQKTCPTGAARPWLPYARARLAEGYTAPEIARTLNLPVHRIQEVRA